MQRKIFNNFYKNKYKIKSWGAQVMRISRRNRYYIECDERRRRKTLTTTSTNDELKNIKDRFHSHDLESNYRKVLMYGSCNESESEEDNVYRQNVASDDRKKNWKVQSLSFFCVQSELCCVLCVRWLAGTSEGSRNRSSNGQRCSVVDVEMWMASSSTLRLAKGWWNASERDDSEPHSKICIKVHPNLVHIEWKRSRWGQEDEKLKERKKNVIRRRWKKMPWKRTRDKRGSTLIWTLDSSLRCYARCWIKINGYFCSTH